LEGIKFDEADGVLKSKTIVEALNLSRMIKLNLWEFRHLVLDHRLMGGLWSFVYSLDDEFGSVLWQDLFTIFIFLFEF